MNDDQPFLSDEDQQLPRYAEGASANTPTSTPRSRRWATCPSPIAADRPPEAQEAGPARRDREDRRPHPARHHRLAVGGGLSGPSSSATWRRRLRTARPRDRSDRRRRGCRTSRPGPPSPRPRRNLQFPGPSPDASPFPSLVGARVHQQKRELVAAQTSDSVELAHIGQQQVSHGHQGGVPCRVAQTVVDALEPVPCRDRAGPPRPRDGGNRPCCGSARTAGRAGSAQASGHRDPRGLGRLGPDRQGGDFGAQPFDLGVQIGPCSRFGHVVQVRLRYRRSRATQALATRMILATLVAGATRVAL